jgi:RNA polymerase sigma factor (sigma-70 family)
MNMSDTHSLLAEYARNGSEKAFREIVDCYIDLVYSTALRMVDGDSHRAKDISQVVFVNLARTAAKLSPNVMLGGWLHRYTCFVVLNVLRQERRRQTHEKQAVEMNALSDSTDFSSLAPMLDEAVNELEELDRTAILLRFYEQRDFRSIGETIGVNDDAARMRVNRALEKLQLALKKHGLTTTAAALAVLLGANVVHAAPVGLAAKISLAAAAVASAGLTTAGGLSTLKATGLSITAKAVIATALVAMLGTTVYQAQQNTMLRDQLEGLQATIPQVQTLAQRRDQADRDLSQLRDENNELKRNTSELRRLRAEITKLRDDSKELAIRKAGIVSDETISEALQWQQRVGLLKQRVAQNPAVGIPEMQLLTERDWLGAAQIDLRSEDDYRNALSELRTCAEAKISGDLVEALAAYIKQNGHFPNTVPDLEPFLKRPINLAILQRWMVASPKDFKAGRLGGDLIVTQSSTPDPEYDKRLLIGPNGCYPITPFSVEK